MTIAKILRGSLPIALIHLSVFGPAQAKESLPSIQALYDSTRPQTAPREVISPIPLISAKPAHAAPKPVPAAPKQARAVAKPTQVAPKQNITELLPIVAEWPTYYLDEMLDKKQNPRPIAPGIAAPKPQPQPIITPRQPERKPVIVAKPTPKPVIAKVGTESQRDPATAKKLDISKLAAFGPQASSYRYDSRMVRAMEIATSRAYGRSQGSCWRYVKNALLSAGLVDSRPTTAYAKQAAGELTSKYGFRRISCSNPYEAPLGSVLVYGGGGAGHVEFRTRSGFVSDFTTPRPSRRPLIGVYVK